MLFLRVFLGRRGINPIGCDVFLDPALECQRGGICLIVVLSKVILERDYVSGCSLHAAQHDYTFLSQLLKDNGMPAPGAGYSRLGCEFHVWVFNRTKIRWYLWARVRSINSHAPPKNHRPVCRICHVLTYRRATPRICSTTAT